jgi:hypothetical protein
MSWHLNPYQRALSILLPSTCLRILLSMLGNTSAKKKKKNFNMATNVWDEITKEVKFQSMLRPTVSRPVCLGVRRQSETREQFFCLLEISFRQSRVCYFVAPSLTRGRVCNLLLLLVLAIAVPLGSESSGTQDHILLPQFLRLPQPGGPGPRIYIPQEQGGTVISPGTGFPFCRLLRLSGLRRRYSNPPSRGKWRKCFYTCFFMRLVRCQIKICD